ncbi:nitroreductase [Sporomusaceae bacterium FL31]|nr:nitroreductase [Sporomusaceae bacterium FL31]GCE34417.1 nitroreductase [Sporomusaceae bacterium]
MLTNEVLDTIKNRRSIRSFTGEQIKEAELQVILEAGRYAPSAGNQQLWHFTVIQNQEILAAISASAKEVVAQFEHEHLQKMAKNAKFHVFHKAPTVILISGKEDGMVIEADCAAVTQNMLLAAESLGIGSCWIDFALFAFASPKGSEYQQQLGVPAGYKPFHTVALGYKKVETLTAPVRNENVVNYIR